MWNADSISLLPQKSFSGNQHGMLYMQRVKMKAIIEEQNHKRGKTSGWRRLHMHPCDASALAVLDNHPSLPYPCN
jgi:hypothetical protein